MIGTLTYREHCTAEKETDRILQKRKKEPPGLLHNGYHFTSLHITIYPYALIKASPAEGVIASFLFLIILVAIQSGPYCAHEESLLFEKETSSKSGAWLGGKSSDITIMPRINP